MKRWFAIKLFERDNKVIQDNNLNPDLKDIVEPIITKIEDEEEDDAESIITSARYEYITKLTSQCVVASKKQAKSLSDKIDSIVTNRYLALPIFAVIIFIMYYISVTTVGTWMTDWTNDVLFGEIVPNALTALCSTLGVADWMQHLLIDGVVGGVGTVLGFVPQILLIFVFLSILEDTGYMARIAFVMDKLLRKIGLSGRSVVPMLMGFGCSVPAVMSSRTLPSDRDRKMTIMLVPFMSCTAKLPIYAFFTAAFFPGHGAIVMGLLYFLGIVVGILTALLSKNTFFKGEAVPFVMELPNYRLPSARNVLQLLWEKSKDFIQRAFTIIFVASIVIWFLQNFGLHLQLVKNPDDSILAYCASFIAPIFKPLGFGDWRITSALITGFMAKESVVSTLTVLFGSTAHIMSTLTTLSAASLLVFCLLYTPCVAAIASIKRELGGRWAGFIVIFQCVIAYLCAFIVHTIGLLF